MQNAPAPMAVSYGPTRTSERLAKFIGGEIVVIPQRDQSSKRPRQGYSSLDRAAFLGPTRSSTTSRSHVRTTIGYQQFYRPSVIASKTLARQDSDDYFSIQVMNKVFFLKTALDADYQATNVRLDSRRFYSISKSTRVQEIEDYGQPSEHRLRQAKAAAISGSYSASLASISATTESTLRSRPSR